MINKDDWFKGWRAVGRFRIGAGLFLLVCLAAVLAELLIVQLAPMFIPSTWYLKHYLAPEGLELPAKFLRGELYNEPDDLRGWRNKPGGSAGPVKFDRFGSRSCQGVGPEKSDKLRVVMVGNSLVNGWVGVTNCQTINAFLENDRVETLNFGVMGYALDQFYLDLKRIIPRHRPDVVVIGLDSNSGKFLDALYLPFFWAKEDTVPFIKPRFLLDTTGLHLIVPPYAELLRNIPDNPALVEYLRQYDPQYTHFDRFTRWGLTPVMRTVGRLGHNLRWRLNRRVREKSVNWELAQALFREIVDLTEREKVRLICLLMPGKVEVEQAHPKAYGFMLDYLRTFKNIDVIDVRQTFRFSTEWSHEELFFDEEHFSVQGNELVAGEIKKLLPLAGRAGG